VTASADRSAAIEIDGLVKRYGARAVVDGVSFTVNRGEIVGLLGPNGAGKTTTVEIIEGYRRSDGGTIRVLAEKPWRAGRDLRARVGLMLQDGGFDLRARPRETIEQYARFHDDPRDPHEVLDSLGLGAVARTPYRRLSGGERQRLGLAVALVGRPEVLILDEPTSGMDPEARVTVRSLIGGCRSEGAAILMTSHELADVERLVDRIVIIASGGVVASGTPQEVVGGMRPRLRFRLDRPLGADELVGLAHALGSPVTLDDGVYAVDDAAIDPALIATLAGWCAMAGRLIVELRTGGGTLEDAYLELVGSAVDP